MLDPARPLRLQLFGAPSIRATDGREATAALAQPKRMALLAYLAAAAPYGFHRRDTLLALFWPEADTHHARTALRTAVHFLRRELGSGVIANRGDEELGIDEAWLWCDVPEFDRELASDHVTEALALYRGDLLPGFFVPDAPGFERWLDEERLRLRGRRAMLPGRSPAGSSATGTWTAPRVWARWAAALTPEDERAARRLIALLGRLGDRAGAIRVHDELAALFRREYTWRPRPRPRNSWTRSAAAPRPPRVRDTHHQAVHRGPPLPGARRREQCGLLARGPGGHAQHQPTIHAGDAPVRRPPHAAEPTGPRGRATPRPRAGGRSRGATPGAGVRVGQRGRRGQPPPDKHDAALSEPEPGVGPIPHRDRSGGAPGRSGGRADEQAAVGAASRAGCSAHPARGDDHGFPPRAQGLPCGRASAAQGPLRGGDRGVRAGGRARPGVRAGVVSPGLLPCLAHTTAAPYALGIDGAGARAQAAALRPRAPTAGGAERIARRTGR